MALSFSNKARGTIGSGLKLEVWEVTEDGSTTTITAANLDLNDIVSAMVVPKAPLEGTEAYDAADFADGAMVANDVAVVGAVLGDVAVASINVDLVDLTLHATVTTADVVTTVLNNCTGGNLNLADKVVKCQVLKHKGLSTYSGSSIVFGPVSTSGDVWTLWVVGW